MLRIKGAQGRALMHTEKCIASGHSNTSEVICILLDHNDAICQLICRLGHSELDTGQKVLVLYM